MATIYHRYEPGDSTFICPQSKEITDDSPQVINVVRRLSEQSERRLSEQRRRSSIVSEKTSVFDGLQSMREGKLPTNEHLNRFMNRLLNSKTIKNNKRSMSSDGQLLLKDFQELLIAFQHALQTNNRDELFQSMIYHVRKSEIALDKESLATPVGQQVQDDMKTSAKSILTIAKLFLFNSQFRSILEQILTIAQQTMGGDLPQGGKMLNDNAKSSVNKIRSSYDDQTDSVAVDNRDIDASSQNNRLRNGAFGGSGGAAALAALAGGIGYLGSNKDKTDLNHPAEATTTPNQRNISSSSGLEHNPHIDAAHIPVPEEHMDFLSHRFAEAEHGAPTTDDGGNLIMTEGVDLKSVAPSSDSGYNSNLTHHPHAGTAQLPVPDEHLDFLSHRFAEAEHGAPTTDDGGNTIFANGFDPTSSLLASGSGISSRLLRQDNQQDRSRDQLDQSFLHNRLDDFTAIFTTTAPTTAAAEKVSLTPKTNIGVGAGYNDSNNPVPADEVIDNLRRKASASYAGAGLAGAGLASAASRRSISHGQVKRRVSIFPNGESIIDRLDQDTTTNTGNQFNKGASIGQTGTADSERTSDPRKSSHGIGASGMSAAGVGAGVGTLRGIDDEGRGDHSQDSILKDRLSKGSEGVEEIKADQSLVHGPGSQDETLYKSPTDLLDNTTRNIQNNAIHPNDSDTQEKTLDNTTGNIQENNASDMLATNQSTSGDKSRAAAMAATGAGLGAGLGTMMTNRDNQTSNLQSSQDQNQSIGPLATNDQYDFTRDTPISANKLVNKLETSTSDLIDDDGESISADEIIRQLKDILAKIQKNPEYQQAISSLLSLFNDWSQYLKSGTMDDRRRSSAVSASEQKEYYATTASREAKTIIEDWAQSKSLDPLIQKGSDLASKLKQDDNLQKLYEKVLDYAQKLLKEPCYMADDQSTNDGKELIKEVRHSALEKYKPDVNSIIQESNSFILAVSEDPNLKEISEKIKSIHNHLWYDRNGNAAFKPQLLNDIRITLIPALIEQVKYVPLPQIIYNDKQYEIVIENMILEGDTLMPDVFEVKVDDYLRFSPKANLSYTNSQSMQIHMTGIQTMMDDVVFYYKKKTGFPRVSDSGVVSVHTGGTGLKISMKVISSSVDQTHTFKVDQCHCHIDKLNFEVQSSKHNVLYKVFNPVLKGIIKRQLAKAIEAKMTTMLENGDVKITKHLFAKQESGQLGSNDTRRPGLFSHMVSLLSQKVSAI